MAFSFTTRPTAHSTDETGWRQDRKRAWLWTVVTAGLTVLRIDRGRGGTVVEELLGTQLAGVVGSHTITLSANSTQEGGVTLPMPHIRQAEASAARARRAP